MKLMNMLLVLVFLFTMVMVVQAEEKMDKMDMKDSKTINAVMTGKLDCLSCSLKMTEKAGAQCSKYGHKEALKVSSAKTSDGKELDIKKGTWVHFLDTDKSMELNKTLKHGAKVEITGKYYSDAGTIEIESYKKIEETK